MRCIHSYTWRVHMCECLDQRKTTIRPNGHRRYHHNRTRSIIICQPTNIQSVIIANRKSRQIEKLKSYDFGIKFLMRHIMVQKWSFTWHNNSNIALYIRDERMVFISIVWNRVGHTQTRTHRRTSVYIMDFMYYTYRMSPSSPSVH